MKIIKYLIFGFSIMSLIFLLGCGQTSNPGGSTGEFKVSGALNAAIVSTSSITMSTAANIDKVYAVNTDYNRNSEWRKIANVNTDGSFSIDLGKGEGWVLAFLDTTQTGADMIQAIFKADQLDCIAPKLETTVDETDLGTLDITSMNAIVTSSVYSGFLSDIGYTAQDATIVGAGDDLMLRYINPDINGNGTLDMDENLELDITFWVEYSYGDGQDLITNNITQGIALPTTLNVTYNSCAPELRIEAGAGSKPSTFTLAWTEQGDHPSSSATNVDSGAFNDDGNWNFKFNFGAVNKAPQGTYTYTIDSTTLNFTNFATPADLSDVDNYVFPFPILNVDGLGDITSIDYTWMKYDANQLKFVEADSNDIELVLGNSTAEIKFYTDAANKDDAHGIYITIDPANNSFAVSDNVLVSEGTAGTSFTGKREDVVEIAISFVSKMGLWMKLTIN